MFRSAQVIKLRDEERHHKFRDGGRRAIQERDESEYIKLIRKEAGQVVGFYETEVQDQGKSLQEVVDRLNQDVVFERYQVFSDNGKVLEKPRIIKVLLPNRAVNAERLLKFLKNDAVRFYRSALEAAGYSDQEVIKALRRLTVRGLLRKTQELMTEVNYADELFDLATKKLSPSEVELILNLQVSDENKILQDIEDWKKIARAKEVVKPLSDEDLVICMQLRFLPNF